MKMIFNYHYMYSLIDKRYTLSRGRLLCRVFHIFRRERNILCFVPNAAARSRKTLSSVGTAAKKLKRPRLKQIPHLRRSPPAEEAPIPRQRQKAEEKEGRSPRFRARTSACRRGSCQQQPVPKQHCRKSGKAYRRQLERSISGKWRRYHPRKKSRWLYLHR